MPLEAAQCARSAGDHKLAAAAFEKVGEFGEAAQSYVAIEPTSMRLSATTKPTKSIVLWPHIKKFETENLITRL